MKERKNTPGKEAVDWHQKIVLMIDGQRGQERSLEYSFSETAAEIEHPGYMSANPQEWQLREAGLYETAWRFGLPRALTEPQTISRLLFRNGSLRGPLREKMRGASQLANINMRKLKIRMGKGNEE